MKNPIDAVAHIKHAGQYGCTHPGMAGRIRSRVMVRNLLAALLFMFGLLSCGGTERNASREAYDKHIASAHFQKYKQGTLHMVKSLELTDQTPLNPDNRIKNFIK